MKLVKSILENKIYYLFFVYIALSVSYISYLVFFTPTNYINSVIMAIWAFLYPSILLFIIIYQAITFSLRNPNGSKLFIPAAMSGLIQFVLLFSYVYKGTGLFSVESNKIIHNGFVSVYFSIITITTVGYGDYIPANNAGRVTVMAESILGYFILAIFIAAFVEAIKKTKSQIYSETKHIEINTKLLEIIISLQKIILSKEKNLMMIL